MASEQQAVECNSNDEAIDMEEDWRANLKKERAEERGEEREEEGGESLDDVMSCIVKTEVVDEDVSDTPEVTEDGATGGTEEVEVEMERIEMKQEPVPFAAKLEPIMHIDVDTMGTMGGEGEMVNGNLGDDMDEDPLAGAGINRRGSNKGSHTGRVTDRQHYTAAFKLGVVRCAEVTSNRRAGAHFGVNESCIRRWRRQLQRVEMEAGAVAARSEADATHALFAYWQLQEGGRPPSQGLKNGTVAGRQRKSVTVSGQTHFESFAAAKGKKFGVPKVARVRGDRVSKIRPRKHTREPEVKREDAVVAMERERHGVADREPNAGNVREGEKRKRKEKVCTCEENCTMKRRTPRTPKVSRSVEGVRKVNGLVPRQRVSSEQEQQGDERCEGDPDMEEGDGVRDGWWVQKMLNNRGLELQYNGGDYKSFDCGERLLKIGEEPLTDTLGLSGRVGIGACSPMCESVECARETRELETETRDGLSDAFLQAKSGNGVTEIWVNGLKLCLRECRVVLERYCEGKGVTDDKGQMQMEFKNVDELEAPPGVGKDNENGNKVSLESDKIAGDIQQVKEIGSNTNAKEACDVNRERICDKLKRLRHCDDEGTPTNKKYRRELRKCRVDESSVTKTVKQDSQRKKVPTRIQPDRTLACSVVKPNSGKKQNLCEVRQDNKAMMTKIRRKLRVRSKESLQESDLDPLGGSSGLDFEMLCNEDIGGGAHETMESPEKVEDYKREYHLIRFSVLPRESEVRKLRHSESKVLRGAENKIQPRAKARNGKTRILRYSASVPRSKEAREIKFTDIRRLRSKAKIREEMRREINKKMSTGKLARKEDEADEGSRKKTLRSAESSGNNSIVKGVADEKKNKGEAAAKKVDRLDGVKRKLEATEAKKEVSREAKRLRRSAAVAAEAGEAPKETRSEVKVPRITREHRGESLMPKNLPEKKRKLISQSPRKMKRLKEEIFLKYVGRKVLRSQASNISRKQRNIEQKPVRGESRFSDAKEPGGGMEAAESVLGKGHGEIGRVNVSGIAVRNVSDEAVCPNSRDKSRISDNKLIQENGTKVRTPTNSPGRKEMGSFVGRTSSVFRKVNVDWGRQRNSAPAVMVGGRVDESRITEPQGCPKYLLGQMGCLEETEVELTGGENRVSRFTVLLGVVADGRKLPPLVVLKGEKLPSSEELPRGVVFKSSHTGLLSEELMLAWVANVWNRRPGALLRVRSLLTVSGSCVQSLTATVRITLDAVGTDLVMHPKDCSSQVLAAPESEAQFRHTLRQLNEEWLRTQSGVRELSVAQAGSWIRQAWETVPATFHPGSHAAGCSTLPIV